MDAEPLVVERRPDGIVTLTFNRPRVRNAINQATLEALTLQVRRLSADAGLRAVIVTGAGGAFVSGGDIKELRGAYDRVSGQRYCGAMTQNLGRLSELPIPVIAAIEGYCLGGGMEIALACDLRFVAEGARLGFRQIRLGLTPGWGGAARLVELVGPAVAKRLLWESRDLGADEALRFGLAEERTSEGGALAAAVAFAERCLEHPPLAVAGVKAVVDGLGHLEASEGAAFEHEAFLDLWASEDHGEAVEAFWEGRSPSWKGK